MITRLLELPTHHSFFLFGPRGTGKSTLIRDWLKQHRNIERTVLQFDLLDPDLENEFSRRPKALAERIEGNEGVRYVVLDECQKVPALLDVVHSLIESKRIKFVMTGSSARKLKRGAANLLAGRAFEFHLHPLTQQELGKRFSLADVLHWGSLPGLLPLKTDQDKKRFLRAYAHTYLREEIVAEQLVRNVDRFREFLPVAAQANGNILNFSKMSRQSGVDEKSISRFFDILIDTLVGFYLEPFHRSVRKRQYQKPKFFFFDLGVTRAMAEHLELRLLPSSSLYGHAFEHFFILELIRRRDYAEAEIRLSYLQTSSGVEVDLIVERTGRAPVLVEIKSADKLTADHSRNLELVADEFPESERLIAYRGDAVRKLSNGIRAMPWSKAIDFLLR